MDDGLRLRDLLPDRFDSMAIVAKDRLCQDREINGMKLAWGAVADKLGEALDAALDHRVIDIIAESWAQAEPVVKLASSVVRSPGKPCIIQLGQHEISREMKPVVSVTIGSCPCIELSFLLEVTAHVSGVRVTIVDGYIASGDLGEAWASGKLSFEGVPLHSQAESRKLPIGKGFHFDPPGVAIPGLGRPAAAGTLGG